VAKALVDAVTVWGRKRGATKIKGPLGFSDMDREGLLVEGYENESPFTVIYNYPYYGEYLERMGFSKDVDWTQRIAKVTDQLPPMFQFAGLIEQRYGLHVFQARSTKELADRYGLAIFHMYNETFAPLFQFTPLTDKQIDRYLKTYVPILRPEFVSVCLDKDDRPVGFTFCVPSLAKAVKKARGRLFPLGFVHILRALRRNDTLEALMIGVLPEYRSKGVNALMFYDLIPWYNKYGIEWGESQVEMESNENVQGQWSYFHTEHHKRRRCYVRQIE